MLHDALEITDGPCAIRFPKTPAPSVDDDQVGRGLAARQVRAAADPAQGVCLIGVGKMLVAATGAAELLTEDGIDCTVWDPRCVKPLDEAMLTDALDHRVVVTIEDGFAAGGIGSAVATWIDGQEASLFFLANQGQAEQQGKVLSPRAAAAVDSLARLHKRIVQP